MEEEGHSVGAKARARMRLIIRTGLRHLGNESNLWAKVHALFGFTFAGISTVYIHWVSGGRYRGQEPEKGLIIVPLSSSDESYCSFVVIHHLCFPLLFTGVLQETYLKYIGPCVG